MEETAQNTLEAIHQSPEALGSVPNASATFGKIPNGSEDFRNMRNDSETFRTIPKNSERKENHTLTVREVARMFESAGVARTERSIVNWSQANAHGVARLDAYYDPNERKYYITPQSVDLAIAEEKAKAAKVNSSSEPVRPVRNDSEAGERLDEPEIGTERTVALQTEVMDLKILNKGKDYLIEQLRQERDGFFGQLLDASRKVGELETRLLQLKPGKAESGQGVSVERTASV
jgi:hypothetical protein